jgi:RNA recognition motif-containing protein
MNLYVGNLPYSTGDQELRDLFSPFGEVRSARVMIDRETGRSRGFGFVELDDAAAQKAVVERNGFEVGGRKLVVNEARPREERPRFGGGGGGYRGGGGGGEGGGGGWGGGGGGWGGGGGGGGGHRDGGGRGGRGGGGGGEWRPKGGPKSRRPRVEDNDYGRDEY